MPWCETFDALLDCMGRGQLHFSVTGTIARATVRDNIATEALRALASCGTNGSNPQNFERDVHVWLRSLWGMGVQPHWLELRLKNERAQWVTIWLPVIAVHEMLHAIWHAGQGQ